jgi:transposase
MWEIRVILWAVPPGRDAEPIREFGCWTAALREMAEWLRRCQIQTVAMQATGVYWMALQEVLEKAGLEVFVVNARRTKNLPDRKSDVQECEWLRKFFVGTGHVSRRCRTDSAAGQSRISARP